MFKAKKLLEKEEEFVKLNAELDLETKDLMEQVDQVMRLHEHKNDQIDFEDVLTDNKGKVTSETKENKKIIKIFSQTNKIENGVMENGKDEGKPNEDVSGSFENHNGLDKSDADESDSYFPKLDESFEQSAEDSKDENKFLTKPFLSLNREKSNRNLKPTGSAKLPSSIISTTNIGQGLSLPGKLIRHKSETKLKEKVMDNNVLPESMKGMGQEGIVRFLKAKVKMLTEQLEIIQKDEKKHIEKIKDLQNDRERVAEDRDKWIQQANIAKNVLVKHEQHASNIVVQLQNTQAENGHLKREIEKLKKELKQINQNSGSNEVRLNRSIEELEKLKTSLRQAKQDEKDLRETHRKKTEELSGAVKRLDKQRVELLHAFKKQLIIIDNLKKQKGLIEAGKLVKSIEDDFMEFLDWNPNKI